MPPKSKNAHILAILEDDNDCYWKEELMVEEDGETKNNVDI